VSERV